MEIMSGCVENPGTSFRGFTPVVDVNMGCGGSKVDDSPLVILCRERKELLKAASEHRYALAAAHVSYFQSLKEIGDALRKFVDEELVIGTGSSSPSSPVLTLPSDEGKQKKPKSKGKDTSSSSTSISHSVSISDNNSPQEEDIEGSHLHLSSGSDSDSELGSSSGHIHIEHSPEEGGGHIHIEDSPEQGQPSSYGYYPPKDWNPYGVNSSAYYMKRSALPVQSEVYEEPERHTAETGRWPESSYGYQGYSSYGSGGFFGFPMGTPPPSDYRYNTQPSPPPPPVPPSPPRVSTWDFLNVFDAYDTSYPAYYSQSKYGLGSTTSSPDSKEVREREGIPDLEDETEQEVFKAAYKEKKKLNEGREQAKVKDPGEGTSKAVSSQSSSEGSSKTVPFHSSDSSPPAQEKEIEDSPDTVVSKNSEEEYARKKGVSFEINESPTMMADAESSRLSSLTTLSAHGTRELREVVKEIRDEFETASGYGKDVAVLLEVGKLPYRPRGTTFKVTFSRILYLVAPSIVSSHPQSRPSIRQPYRLYAWEKKLYKEVKDEERLRVIYEKKCKRLKVLDDRGAESSVIDATQASIRKLQTKIEICIRTIDAISSRIHKLRDQELEPQVTELIHGLIRMWKFMLKCHQKQFQAIMDSKTRSLKMNTGLQRDAGLKATVELEMELLNWCTRFNDWVKTQKSYVESLNGWLMRCLLNEPEETPDGVAPFSPSRMRAPPIFIICNDWQDEEQRQRIKAEYLTNDFEKRLRTLRMDTGKAEHHHGSGSDKTALSRVPSDSGVSPLDDLKVDLDLMKSRLQEERTKHKLAIKLVHDAASNSLQAGLVPIFKTLESFTSDVLKAHEQVRLKNEEANREVG
ncbi:Protein of unknown function (DUF630 and DUF632) [Quillaja saponaria]|uniref:Nitrate regulatory gene2 protein-like n=1 Tax=Quillaja saponaria TaxID=32244 RepID=A0AAD7LWI3_QUISA|nr:Protein of unknown function (DUF630 and DUF632) [Quillaja saponaria]